MALQDAWELAQQLVDGGHSSAQAAISQYAERGAQRSADAISRSRRIIALIHSEGWRKLLFVSVLTVLGAFLRLGSGLSNRVGSWLGSWVKSQFAKKRT